MLEPPHRLVQSDPPSVQVRVRLADVGMEDILAVMARQRAEQKWTYGILYDLQDMTGAPTSRNFGSR
jgi:hypothetical protein